MDRSNAQGVFVSVAETQMHPLIQQIVQNIMPHVSIILLEGSMGSGKTTLIRHLLEYFGVESFLGSPTFQYLHEYPIHNKGRFKTMYHMDCERLTSPDELDDLEIDVILAERESLILIENHKNLFGDMLSQVPYGLIQIKPNEENRAMRDFVMELKN